MATQATAVSRTQEQSLENPLDGARLTAKADIATDLLKDGLAHNDRKQVIAGIREFVKEQRLTDLGNTLINGFADPRTRESTMRTAIETARTELAGQGLQPDAALSKLGAAAIQKHLEKNYSTSMNDPSFFALRGHAKDIAEATKLGESGMNAAVAAHLKSVEGSATFLLDSRGRAHDKPLTLAERHREIHDLAKLFKLDEKSSAAQIDQVLQKQGIEALQKLFAQNGTKPLPFAFMTKATHIKDNFALTDKQVESIAQAEVKKASENLSGLSHDKLIATKEYASSISSKFDLKDGAKPHLDAIEHALVVSAARNITSAFAGKITKETFRKVDGYADSASLPSHFVKDIAAAEAVRRLARATGPGEDLTAAKDIAREYRLIERNDVKSALMLSRDKLLMEKFSDIANTLLSPNVSVEQKIAFTKETARKYDLPTRAVQEVVVKAIEARTARELLSSPTAEDLVRARQENVMLRASFEDRRDPSARGAVREKGFIESHSRYLNAEKMINEKALSLIGSSLSNENDPRPILDQLKSAHSLAKELRLDSGAVRRKASEAVCTLIDRADVSDGISNSEELALVQAAAVIESFGLEKDKAVNDRRAALSKKLDGAMKLLAAG